MWNGRDTDAMLRQLQPFMTRLKRNTEKSSDIFVGAISRSKKSGLIHLYVLHVKCQIQI